MSGVRVIATSLPVWTLAGGRRVPIGSRVPVALEGRTRGDFDGDRSLRALRGDEPAPGPPVWTERERATRAEIASLRARLDNMIAAGFVPAGHPDLRRTADWLDVLLACEDPTCLHLAGVMDLRRFVGEFERAYADPHRVTMRKLSELAGARRAALHEASSFAARLSELKLPATRESEVLTTLGDLDGALRARQREDATVERRAALKARIEAAEQRAAEAGRQIEAQPFTPADELVAKHLNLGLAQLGMRRCVALSADGIAKLADGTSVSLHGRAMRDDDEPIAARPLSFAAVVNSQ